MEGRFWPQCREVSIFHTYSWPLQTMLKPEFSDPMEFTGPSNNGLNKIEINKNIKRANQIDLIQIGLSIKSKAFNN